MQKSSTPWAATLQSDLGNAVPLWESEIKNYRFSIYNTGDSIWLVVHWQNGGRIAFRMAFAMNSRFEEIQIKETEKQIRLTTKMRLGKYKIELALPEHEQLIFRYTTTFEAAFPFIIPFWLRDIVPLTREGRIENTSAKIHTHQIGGRSGQIYFSMTKPKTGSVFYFQNLSAISPYCEACETSLAETVGGNWPEVGFQLPINFEKPIPANVELVLSDAFVVLSEEIPEKDFQVSTQFLDCLASVYRFLPKPAVEYRDWPDLAEKTLRDLHTNKGCWAQTQGTPFLNAYVTDYKTPPEIMVQLAVLTPLREYLDWKGESHEVSEFLRKGLSQFYDEEIKSILRWHPELEDQLDHSEEQKKEMVMDSWYLHHPLMNLARLALKGDLAAKKLFLNSIDYAIKVARHFGYEWPVFYKMTTLEVLKAETAPGNGGEKDVPGSYAHIMLLAFQLTGEKSYLKEAMKAVRNLEGLGFDVFYQANNTAFAAGALAELYLETGNEEYLELSYSCLAGIFKNVKLWECGYGHGKYFPDFFAVYPLNDAPYTAAYEELEVYAALNHYLQVTKKIDLLPSLRTLLPEFIKYAINRMPFYYPPLLPPDIISEETKTGEIQHDLWIPLEDLYDGWEDNGQVGQEVYGAGLPFGVVPRQYYQIEKIGAMLYSNYPISNFRVFQNKVSFHIIGNPEFQADLKILQGDVSIITKLKVEQKFTSKYEEVPARHKSNRDFSVQAGTLIRISW